MERLYRSRRQRVLGGVAGGLAEYFGVDVVLVRLLWVMTLFFGGAGFFAYIIAWIIIPDELGANDQGEPAFTDAARDTEEDAGKTAAAESESFDVRGRDGRRFKNVDNRQRYAGLILIGLGVFFFLREIMPWSIFRYIWPLVLIIIGIYFLIRGLRGGE